MKTFFRKTVSVITCIVFGLFSITSTAYAEEEIATITEGEPAPFSGTLFNTEAAARLLLDLETNQALFNLECTRRLELQQAEMQLEIDVIQASRDALQLRFDDTLVVKNDHIDFLERQVTKRKMPPEVVFIIGVVSGVALTMGSAYAIGQVSQN